MNKHDNESEFGLRVFIRYAETNKHTHTPKLLLKKVMVYVS